MPSGFNHLHLHTDRTLCNGLIKHAQLAAWAKMNGLDAACTTELGNLSGAPLLAKACKASKLKPIYGAEMWLAEDKTKKERGTRHIILLAKNKTGFDNLVQLSTLASMYFYYIPRIDFGDLEKYGEGLILSTACIKGIAAPSFFQARMDGMAAMYDKYAGLFGDDFYIEIQPSPNDTQRVFNEACRQFVTDVRPDAKLLLTADCHYFTQQDEEFHRQFMRLGAKGDQAQYQYPYHGNMHVMNYDQMVEAFSEMHGYDITMVPAFKQGLENAAAIAAQTEAYEISTGVKIPVFT